MSQDKKIYKKPGMKILVGILHGQGVPFAPGARYALALAIFALALTARFLLLPLEGGLAFLTFYPAVGVAALICGARPGLLAVALGAVAGPYVFMAPYFSVDKFAYHHVLPAMVFVLSGAIICFLTDRMQHHANEERATNRRLQAALRELERSNRELDEFAYVASHDLREPLRGIHNYASFLQEDYADCLDDQGKHYLERMQRLAERQSTLIDHLLAYSRVGTTELAIADTDVDQVLDDVLEDLKPLLTEQRVVLVRPARLPALRCNALRVGEVFQNLIANAIKYNDRPDKQVEVGCLTAPSPPVFYVRDNGIGIAAKHQDSIFRIFKRLHEQGKYGGGSGAGLTIVKKIIERHGGRIWLESTLGEGTTFYFTLSDNTP